MQVLDFVRNLFGESIFMKDSDIKIPDINAILNKKYEPEKLEKKKRGGFLFKLKIAFVSLLILTLVAATLAFFGLRRYERAVTFHPVREDVQTKWIVPAHGEDVWFNDKSGIRLNGWFAKAQFQQPPAATVIFFHGNGGNISNVAWLVEKLTARGFDVLAIDYRGYGRSGGEATNEQNLFEDGDAAYDYLTRERGVRPETIALYGHSLGTTVATDVASRKTCGALVLEASLASAREMAHQVAPRLPEWSLRFGANRLDNLGKIANVRCPLLITHGTRDRIIPVAQARELYDAARDPKQLIILPDVDHDIWLTAGDDYLNSVGDFIKKSIKQ